MHPRSALSAVRVIFLLLSLAAVAAAAANEDLRKLADAARGSMAARIEPPIARLPFNCILRRTPAAPMREYILAQQAEAVDALVAAAEAPGEGKRIRRLLNELRREGYSRDADIYLAQTNPAGARGLRLAASLGELPAALEPVLVPFKQCSGKATFGVLGRTFQPLGTLARGDFQRLVTLEPAEPWHALALGWLSLSKGEPALQQAIEAARARPDENSAQVVIWALHQLAWIRLSENRLDDMQRSATEAMQLSEAALRRAGEDLSQLTAERALRNVANSASMLAMLQEDAEQPAAAFATLQRAAAAQRRLIELRPDDALSKVALIDSLIRLATLRDAAGASAASASSATVYQGEAWAIYRQQQMQTPYTPMIASSNWPGMLVSTFVVAALSTWICGWILLRCYRNRVATLMMSASRSTDAVLPAVSDAPVGTVLESGKRDTLAPITRAAVAQRYAAFVQVLAGFAFGLAAAWLLLRADDTEPSVIRMILMSWTWGWPTVLALGLIWDGDRRRQRVAWGVYFAGLLLICLVIARGETPPLSMFGVDVPPLVQGLLYWAISLSISPLLLLFLNRSLRSIGPALLTMMIVTTTGGLISLLASSTPVGMDAVVTWGGKLHVPAGAMLPLTILAGMLLFAPLAWWLGRRLRDAYAARWLSDQSLMIDTLWGFQTLLLTLDLMLSIGPVGAMALGVFVLHKSITWFAMAPVAHAARAREPLRLLLLRVFTQRDKHGRRQSRRADAERLFDLLGSRWRYVGPIAMIGAPDLASSTIDPVEFLDFLAGRLRERFITEPAEVPARLAAIDDSGDHDARWRVTESFCGNDAWRQAVLGLMGRSDLVAMDLRSFGPDNQGCIFELQALVDFVPAERVALLVNKTTDQRFLQTTLQECIAKAHAGSPNAHSKTRMAIVDIDAGEATAVNELMRLATAVRARS
jgi:hypothetical protein